MCGISVFCKSLLPFIRYQKVFERGPDDQILIDKERLVLYFSRRSIRAVNTGAQPLYRDDLTFVCNGEIYCGPKYVSDDDSAISDVEWLFDRVHHAIYNHLPLSEVLSKIDGEFAFVCINWETHQVWWGRDRMGIRPLYLTVDMDTGDYALSSVPSCVQSTPDKNLITMQVPGGHLGYTRLEQGDRWSDFVQLPFSQIPQKFNHVQLENFHHQMLFHNIAKSVQKRLHYDRSHGVQMGCFLSGGLDSAIVAAITMKYHPSPDDLVFFTLGSEDSLDVKSAKMIASHIGIKHHVIVDLPSHQEIHDFILKDTIYKIGTSDITTVRASVMQNILCKHIHDNFPSIKTMMTGEGADELFMGYLYFRDTQDITASGYERLRLLNQLSHYDVLRTDHISGSHGLEVRVPFLDKFLVDYVLTQLSVKSAMPFEQHIEKYLLRKSVPVDLLPTSIIWRTKEAFSDSPSGEQNLPWFRTLPGKLSESELYNQILRECDYVVPQRPLGCRTWLPSWQPNAQLDPSARMLANYTIA